MISCTLVSSRYVNVEPSALTLLAKQAMYDIAHFLRPGHLQQLRNILAIEQEHAMDLEQALGK